MSDSAAVLVLVLAAMLAVLLVVSAATAAFFAARCKALTRERDDAWEFAEAKFEHDAEEEDDEDEDDEEDDNPGMREHRRLFGDDELAN